MIWAAVWCVLALAAVGALFLSGRSLWRKVLAFGRELSAAAQTLAAAMPDGSGQEPRRPEGGEDLAVFTSPRSWQRATRSRASSPHDTRVRGPRSRREGSREQRRGRTVGPRHRAHPRP